MSDDIEYSIEITNRSESDSYEQDRSYSLQDRSYSLQERSSSDRERNYVMPEIRLRYVSPERSNVSPERRYVSPRRSHRSPERIYVSPERHYRSPERTHISRERIRSLRPIRKDTVRVGPISVSPAIDTQGRPVGSRSERIRDERPLQREPGSGIPNMPPPPFTDCNRPFDIFVEDLLVRESGIGYTTGNSYRRDRERYLMGTTPLPPVEEDGRRRTPTYRLSPRERRPSQTYIEPAPRYSPSYRYDPPDQRRDYARDSYIPDRRRNFGLDKLSRRDSPVPRVVVRDNRRQMTRSQSLSPPRDPPLPFTQPQHSYSYTAVNNLPPPEIAVNVSRRRSSLARPPIQHEGTQTPIKLKVHRHDPHYPHAYTSPRRSPSRSPTRQAIPSHVIRVYDTSPPTIERVPQSRPPSPVYVRSRMSPPGSPSSEDSSS